MRTVCVWAGNHTNFVPEKCQRKDGRRATGANTMRFEIRPEQQADFAGIRQLVQDTLGDTPGQDYVAAVRSSDRYVPQLALVALADGVMSGFLMLAKLEIQGPGDTRTELLLAPLCARALPQQGLDIGATLIEEGMRCAERAGYRAVFLVGDPAYYGRFGFQEARRFGIGCTNSIDPRYVLCREIRPGSLGNAGGRITL